MAAMALPACAGAPAVHRAYDGHVVEGRYVEPQAYAAFFKGAVAESSGDTKSALEAYEYALRLDPSSTEIWARVGAVRCAADRHDPRAQEAFDRALAIDGSYAAAWSERAKCDHSKGAEEGWRAFGQRAAELTAPNEASMSMRRAVASAAADGRSREELTALTMTASDPALAWDALADWAHTRGDLALWTTALASVVPIETSRRCAVARAAEELAGLGYRADALAIAGAAVDASSEPLSCSDCALTRRLAVDDAIQHKDPGAISRRSARVLLASEEVAARALLAGEVDVARRIASVAALADPGALGARLVLAAADPAAGLGTGSGAGPREPPSAAAWVSYGLALQRGLSQDVARAVLGAIAHEPIVAGDDRVARAAVELAAAGVIRADGLPGEALVELQALRGSLTVAVGLPLPDPRSLDVRHEYLELALTEPQSRRTRALRARLSAVVANDRVVAAASALQGLATGMPIDRAMPAALLDRDPADPLLVATALRLAESVGDAEVVRRARAAIALLARSPEDVVPRAPVTE